MIVEPCFSGCVQLSVRPAAGTALRAAPARAGDNATAKALEALGGKVVLKVAVKKECLHGP